MAIEWDSRRPVVSVCSIHRKVAPRHTESGYYIFMHASGGGVPSLSSACRLGIRLLICDEASCL